MTEGQRIRKNWNARVRRARAKLPMRAPIDLLELHRELWRNLAQKHKIKEKME